MKNFDLGITYNEYLSLADEEQKGIIDRLNEQSQLINKDLHKVRNIENKLNILVFGEPRCKDAATEIPFLLKLSELNKNIEVKFLRREGNEELLEELSGERKVPTFLILNEKGNTVRKYIEFPIGVKEILLSTEKEKVQDIIDNMRKGKYNDLIQEDIIRFLTGEDYRYINFTKEV